MWTSNNFVKSKNFNTWANESFSFKLLNAVCCSYFHWKDNYFIRRSKSGFAICEKPFVNFQYKLAKPRNDHIPLIVTSLFQSHMACNFLKLGFINTPSFNKMCPRKFIFSWVTHFLPCWQRVYFTKFTQNIL
jgi:hypothetical protein